MHSRLSKNIYLLLVIIGLLSLAAFFPAYSGALAQAGPTPTRPVITVVYDDVINIRAGPHSVYYAIIGHLAPGAQRTAIGRTPAGEWVLIEDATLPGGRGWVYASITYITISPGELPIVDPPPTPSPFIPTIDPTLAAEFSISPTTTRMPTYTPPAFLTAPTLVPLPVGEAGGFPVGVVILVSGLVGLAGILLTMFRRK